MARTTYTSSDTLPTVEASLNANVAKDDALQTATGITESATGVDAVGSDPAAPYEWQTGDTLRELLRKHEYRIENELQQRTTGDANGTARSLGTNGLNYDIGAEKASLIGTTWIDPDAGAAITDQYPEAALGQYLSVAVVREALESGWTQMYERRITCSDGGLTRSWVSMKEDGSDADPWVEITSAPAITLQAPNLTVWQLSVTDAGELVTTQLS